MPHRASLSENNVKSMFTMYGLMKSAIVVPQKEANIEKNLSMTIIYIHRLEIQQANLL